MLAIIWCHVKACRRDLQAHRLGDLAVSRRAGGQIMIGNEIREWRLR